MKCWRLVLALNLPFLILAGCPSPVEESPEIASMIPTEGGAGFRVASVRIEGSNLTDATVSIGGQARIENVVATDHSILFDIDLTSAAEGNYSITIDTPSGSAQTTFAVTRAQVTREAPSSAEVDSSQGTAALFLNQNQQLVLPTLAQASPSVQQMVNELNAYWGLSVKINAYVPGTGSTGSGPWSSGNAVSFDRGDQQIIYDQRWLDSIESRLGSNVFTWMVISHEVGHQVQFQLIGRANLPQVNGFLELMADCLSGVFLVQKGFTLDQVSSAHTATCDPRSQSIWIDPNPATHGSCDERLSAFATSMRAGRVAPNDAVNECMNLPPFRAGSTQPPTTTTPPVNTSVQNIPTTTQPPSGMGCVTVQSAQYFPVSIYINGFAIGILAPFSAGSVPGIPPGQYVLTSVAPDGSYIQIPFTAVAGTCIPLGV